jgi:uncharacterized protein YraI
MTEFIDVSLYDCRRPDPNNGNKFLYDRPMDWSKQVENNAKFAFIKCSEYQEDPGFKVQWNAARKTDLILGAWHFFHPKENAIAQAQLQIGLLKQVGLNWTGDPKTSDKVQLDLETMDGLDPLTVARAVGSWYNEVNNSFPNFEKDIYTGWYFWYPSWQSGTDLSWAKNTKLWMPAYPLDPTPNMKNPPLPFNEEQVESLCAGAFTTYAMKDLPPWGQPSYRQITGYADSRFVPGHPGIKKVVDINVLNPNYFSTPIPIPIPIPVEKKYYINITLANIRSGPSSSYPVVGTIGLNKEVTVSDVSWDYSKIGVNQWVFSKFLSLVTSPLPSTKEYIVNIKLANIRSGPSTSYPIVGTIALNAEVDVYETSNGYSRIGVNQWVATQYLSKK